jgi:hypothetical protein
VKPPISTLELSMKTISVGMKAEIYRLSWLSSMSSYLARKERVCEYPTYQAKPALEYPAVVEMQN